MISYERQNPEEQPDVTATNRGNTADAFKQGTSVLQAEYVFRRSTTAGAIIDVERAVETVHQAESALAQREWRRAWGPALAARGVRGTIVFTGANDDLVGGDGSLEWLIVVVLAVVTVVFAVLAWLAWNFLAVARYDSWEKFAENEKNSVAQMKNADSGWFTLRAHAALHHDTVTDRIMP